MGSDEPFGVPVGHVVASIRDATLDIPSEFEPCRVVAINIDPKSGVVYLGIERVPFIRRSFGGLASNFFAFVSFGDNFRSAVAGVQSVDEKEFVIAEDADSRWEILVGPSG